MSQTKQSLVNNTIIIIIIIIIINNNNNKLEKIIRHQVGFGVSVNHKCENKRKRQIIETCQKTKERPIEQKDDYDTNRSWCTWNGQERLREKTIGIGNQRKNRDYSLLRLSRMF